MDNDDKFDRTNMLELTKEDKLVTFEEIVEALSEDTRMLLPIIVENAIEDAPNVLICMVDPFSVDTLRRIVLMFVANVEELEMELPMMV